MKTLNRATLAVLVGWLIHYVASEWGISGVLVLCLGGGALWGFVTSIQAGATLYQTYKMTRFGLLPGFLAWLVIGAVLGLLGYEMETKSRKRREAAFTAVLSAMREPGEVPSQRLRPGVEKALRTLPSHPNDRPDSISGLEKLLIDPNPHVRSQAMLSLGRFEGYAERLMPLFDAGMNSDDPHLRVAALISLTGMRPFAPEMLNRVITMLADKDRNVRLAATEAAKRITPLLRDEDERKRLRDAIEQVETRMEKGAEGGSVK